jgi:predicted enzyme related to lactoylglutathione lyase
VIGWDAKDSGMADRSYKLFSAGPMMVGGLMPIPEEARAMGARPAWNGYVLVDDVDVYAGRVKAAGGAIHRAKSRNRRPAISAGADTARRVLSQPQTGLVFLRPAGRLLLRR